MKSIMQEKTDGQCFLCMALHDDYSRKTALEEHHAIHGFGKRSLSEKYGLKIYLCPPHHRSSPESIHANTKGRIDIDHMVEQAAQKAFMSEYPKLNFMKIFGKNYIDEEIPDLYSSSQGKSHFEFESSFWDEKRAEKPYFTLTDEEEPIDF